jgi:hypothetical protein
MTRAERKQQIRSIAEKMGKRPRGAANILNRIEASRLGANESNSSSSGFAYMLRHLYEGALQLFEHRPEAHEFVASVYSRERVDTRVMTNGEIATVPLVDITFVENRPAHWWFEGAVAFIEGELYDGEEPVRSQLLETEEGRIRIGEIIVAHIRSEQAWFAERLTQFQVKSGSQRQDNLIVVVSLELIDEEENKFVALVSAFQHAEAEASIAIAKGALDIERGTTHRRTAIATARASLALVVDGAETPQQKALAERCMALEETWKRDEESLDRIEAMGPIDSHFGQPSRDVPARSGDRMRPEARALAQALLDHHRARTSASPPGKTIVPAHYTVRYGDLCSKAGAAHLTRIAGSFLGEIAEWCADQGYPPLNSLAVNETGLPGHGYDGAGGFTIGDWPKEVEECVRFTGYPTSMP